MTDSLYLNTMYFLTIGAMPHLAAPRSFNELINYRKLHDRNPDLVTTSDKYEVRDYVTQRIGPGYLIPSICRPPTRCRSMSKTLPRSLRRQGELQAAASTSSSATPGPPIGARSSRSCSAGCAFPHHTSHREWAYKAITPRVLIEELLWDDGGVLPDDTTNSTSSTARCG